MWRGPLVVLLCVAHMASSASPVRAQSVPASPAARSRPSNGDMEQARMHFRMGVDFYKDRDFRAALIEFRRAYQLAPHYTLLFNLGQTALELKEYVQALEYLSGYLSVGGPALSPTRRVEVERMIADLTSRTATMTITADRAGAEVLMDNEVVGRTPLRSSIRVGAGRRELTLMQGGMELARQTVDVAAGDQVKVQLIASLGTSRAGGRNIELDSGIPSGVLWMGMLTGALAVSAGLMTYVTAATADRYEDMRTSRELVSAGQLHGLRNETKRLAWVTDGLYGATLVSAAVAVILYLSEDERASSAFTGPVTVAADQLVVHGRF